MTPEELAAQEAEAKAAAEAEAKVKAEQDEAVAQENAALKLQIAELNGKLSASKPAGGPSEETWQRMESDTKLPRESIIAVNTMIQTENAELKKTLSDIKSERNFDRVKARIARNVPQFGKVEEHFDAYFDDLPTEAKTDPEKLKRHSERALTFALSKLPPKSKKETEEEPVKKTTLRDDESEDDMDNFFSEVHHTADHSFRMKPKKMISDERRRAVRNPENPKRIQIPTESDWEKKEKEYAESRKK